MLQLRYQNAEAVRKRFWTNTFWEFWKGVGMQGASRAGIVVRDWLINVSQETVMSFARTTSSSKYQQLFLSRSTCRSHFSTNRIYIQKIVNFEIFQTPLNFIKARDRKLFYTFAVKLGI